MDYNLVNWEDEEEDVTDIGEEDAPETKWNVADLEES
jgi:hypothetical protein